MGSVVTAVVQKLNVCKSQQKTQSNEFAFGKFSFIHHLRFNRKNKTFMNKQ